MAGPSVETADPHPRRRTVLVASAVSTLVLPMSACDLLASDESPGTGAPTPTRERDQELVDEAVALETALVRLLAPLTRSGPPQQRRQATLALRVHRDHLELLGSEPPGAGQQKLGRAAQRRRLSRLVRAEERASRRHRDAAVRAASGPFARVLAGMSAASAQQAQVWRS